jgi:hypothetical protein
MAKLSKEQLNFLNSQRISTSLVFDASGFSTTERTVFMKHEEKYFYFGGALCKKAGHSLRTKAGHCIQCDTSKIAFMLRSSAEGFIYLAFSPSNKLIKIGYCKESPFDRAAQLQKDAYGNIKDWEVKQHKWLDINAGKIEFSIHTELERYQKLVTYPRNGQMVECREIFSCNLKFAKKVFNNLTADIF